VVYTVGLPHSEIPGSQVATHLPGAYRRYAASFIALSCRGIHRTPLTNHPNADSLINGIYSAGYFDFKLSNINPFCHSTLSEIKSAASLRLT